MHTKSCQVTMLSADIFSWTMQPCALSEFFPSRTNGRVSPCRYRQKQKSYRNFPPASILAWKGQGEKILKMHIFGQKWPIQILFLLSVPKILKNCLKIVEEKSMAKNCNREIYYFPHPFSSKQHQNLFTSEILPLNF